jgi:hypothetical protein
MGRAEDTDLGNNEPEAERYFLEVLRTVFRLRHHFLPHFHLTLDMHDIQFNACEFHKVTTARPPAPPDILAQKCSPFLVLRRASILAGQP